MGLLEKLSRFSQRLEAIVTDKRLNFILADDEEILAFNYMGSLCLCLMSPASRDGGVKIIDFSEGLSDILPLIVDMFKQSDLYADVFHCDIPIC